MAQRNNFCVFSSIDFVHKGKVSFLGRLSPFELKDRVYIKADTLLLTSLWETGPFVIWEAMRSGIAVVSTQYIGSGLEGALKHEKNSLLFPIGESKMASQHLPVLWKDSALKKRLVNNGYQMINERYSTRHPFVPGTMHFNKFFNLKVCQKSYKIT